MADRILSASFWQSQRWEQGKSKIFGSHVLGDKHEMLIDHLECSILIYFTFSLNIHVIVCVYVGTYIKANFLVGKRAQKDDSKA